MLNFAVKMIKIHTKKRHKATCFLSLMNFCQTRDEKFKDFILKKQSAFETKNALNLRVKFIIASARLFAKTQSAF